MASKSWLHRLAKPVWPIIEKQAQKMERLSIILVCILCTILSKGQGYIDETSEWKEYHYQWGAGFPDQHKTSEFQYSKDTIIAGKDYVELLYKSFDYHTELIGVQVDTVWSGEHISKIYLREVDKKWYKIEGNEDRLMLDFNYEIGDTIHYDWYYDEYYIVQEIEEFEIASQRRKKFSIPLRNFRQFYIYEGIGSSRGFLYPFVDASFEGYKILECYNYQGETFIVDPRAENCEVQILSGVKESLKELNVLIYPNPVKDILTIEMGGEGVEHKIDIFDLNGKKLLEDRLFAGSNTETFQVNISRLPKGMYVLKIGNSLKGLTKRIVKL